MVEGKTGDEAVRTSLQLLRFVKNECIMHTMRFSSPAETASAVVKDVPCLAWIWRAIEFLAQLGCDRSDGSDCEQCGLYGFSCGKYS